MTVHSFQFTTTSTTATPGASVIDLKKNNFVTRQRQGPPYSHSSSFSSGRSTASTRTLLLAKHHNYEQNNQKHNNKSSLSLSSSSSLFFTTTTTKRKRIRIRQPPPTTTSLFSSYTSSSPDNNNKNKSPIVRFLSLMKTIITFPFMLLLVKPIRFLINKLRSTKADEGTDGEAIAAAITKDLKNNLNKIQKLELDKDKEEEQKPKEEEEEKTTTTTTTTTTIAPPPTTKVEKPDDTATTTDDLKTMPPVTPVTPKPVKEKQNTTKFVIDQDTQGRSLVSAPNVDLSGKWKLLVNDEFKTEYDTYLKNLGQPLLVRKVALSIIGMTTEETKQNGKELYIKGTNARGVWERTLISTISNNKDNNNNNTVVNNSNNTILTADSEEVTSESWWQENGTVHKSWLHGVSKYGGGDFESTRYLLKKDNSDPTKDILVCETIFHPTSDLQQIKAQVTWKFYKE